MAGDKPQQNGAFNYGNTACLNGRSCVSYSRVVKIEVGTHMVHNVLVDHEQEES